MAKATRRKVAARALNLALQGGGAHGAFTWGVLDRLLEEPDLAFDGISGTSAGAMNGAVMVAGLATGGNDGAREALEAFWRRVSEAGRFGPIQRTPLDRAAGNWNLDTSPGYLFFEQMTRMLSPYQFNPGNWHPLREILDQAIDFAALRDAPVKLFVSATNVRSGKNRIFDCTELTADVLLASACLPHVFQAVEIDGEAYWDGGFMGNPAIYPLIYECASSDVAIVQVNPIERDTVPTTAPEIVDRLNEISFNSTLMREMRAIAFVTRLIDEGRLGSDHYKRMNVHLIEAEAEMKGLGVSSKLNADWEFLTHLRDVGRTAAQAWLTTHRDDIGERSTVDLAEKFL